MLLECTCFVLRLSPTYGEKLEYFHPTENKHEGEEVLHCRLQSCCVLQGLKWGLEGVKWEKVGVFVKWCLLPLAFNDNKPQVAYMPQVSLSKLFSFLMLLMTNTPNCFLLSYFSVPPG